MFYARGNAGFRGSMVTPATRALMACLAAICMTAVAQAASGKPIRLAQGATSYLTVSAGSTDTMSTSAAFVDLVVGDQDIADVVPLTDRSFYVHGKKLGTTTVSAYDA